LIVMQGHNKWDTPGLTLALQDQISREVPGARVDVRQLEMGPPVGVPVAIRLFGDDMPTLRRLSANLMETLRRNPYAERVHQDWGAESFALDVAIDPDRANRAGLTNADVAVSTAVGLNGLELTSMYRGDQIVPVVARLRMEERARLGDLRNLYVYSSQGGQKVSLPQIATLSTEMRQEQIKRRNRFRTVTVQAFPRGAALPSEVLAYSQKDIDRFAASLPPGFRLEIAGEYEKQQEGFGEMTLVLAISVGLIFIALAVQFQNAIKPFIVFGAIPYGFVGAVAGLWVMGSPFGFMGFLGIASLVGVIVSHVIVLFDFIEEAREKGETLEEALLDAGIQRLRPVLITVGATLFALVPLAMHGGPLWEPLCYAQIGGLAIATVITLLLVPVFYAIAVRDLKVVRWEA
jgi:multidrug efflux pump subunit AcrB